MIGDCLSARYSEMFKLIGWLMQKIIERRNAIGEI